MDTGKPPYQPESKNNEFGLSEPREIVRVLTDLMRRRTPLAGIGNRDGQELLAMIVGVEEVGRYVLLACLSSGCEASADIVAKEGVRFSAQHNELYVRFVAGMARRVRHEGRELFQLPLPAELLCLQRRGVHRVAVPRANPPRCRLPVSDSETLDGIAMDISISGISLSYLSDAPIFSAGQILYGCRLAVPGMGDFVIGLRVCNQVRLVLPGGDHSWRIGCEFINASSAVERELQRYMIKIEREGQAPA